MRLIKPLWTKLFTICLGLSMIAGVGQTAFSNEIEVKAAPSGAITNHTSITNGDYYIGATTNNTNFYLSVSGNSIIDSIAGTAVSSTASATVFTFSGSGTTWTIKFRDTAYYLGLKSSKDNGKLQVKSSEQDFTASTKSGLIRLAVGSYSIQKNNTGQQFGSYGHTQTDIWLLPVGGSTTPIKYNVNYHPNGGTGTTIDSNSYDSNSTATIMTNTFAAPAGKKFSTWNTSASGAGTSYEPGDLLTIGTSDINLYAIWEDIGVIPTPVGDFYTITFDTSSTTDSSTGYTETTLLDSIKGGREYIASISNMTKLYPGAGGLKFGSSSAKGTFTINLSFVGKVKATSIVVNAKGWSGDNTSIKINGSKEQALTTSFANYTFDQSGDLLESIAFSPVNQKARGHITSITVYYESIDETAEESAKSFALDFLAATDNCKTNAASVWASQKTAFNALSNEAKTLITNATYDVDNYEANTAIQQCAQRYDLAVARQGLENFMGRAIDVNALRVVNRTVGNNYNANVTAVIVIGLLGLTTIGGYYFLKSKKQ